MVKGFTSVTLKNRSRKVTDVMMLKFDLELVQMNVNTKFGDHRSFRSYCVETLVPTNQWTDKIAVGSFRVKVNDDGCAHLSDFLYIAVD
jgi:hypothetical protein